MADVIALPGLPMPRRPGPDGTYPEGLGPHVRDHAQLYQLTARARASAVLPESCQAHLRHDLAAVPMLTLPRHRLTVLSEGPSLPALITTGAMDLGIFLC